VAGNLRFLPSGAALVALVAGDIDEATSPAIGRALAIEARGAGCRGLVIDLQAVTFLGSIGVSMLLDVRRTLLDRGTVTHLLCHPSSMPRRILQITSLDELFAIHTSLRDALVALDGDGCRDGQYRPVDN
jgi:anti-sigma B factor antagonist